jgi:transposase-like protein
MNTIDVALVRETEVADKATRRTFTAEYKRRIVKEADACKASGEIGSLLRREGLYSSQLANWRSARDHGDLAPGAAAKKRGPRASEPDPNLKRIAELERQIARLTRRAERAEEIVEVRIRPVSPVADGFAWGV